MTTYIHSIDVDRCKGCGLCVAVCPKKVLEISDKVNTKGYFPAYQAHPENCIFCTICCIMCPDVAISVSEKPDEKPVEEPLEEPVEETTEETAE